MGYTRKLKRPSSSYGRKKSKKGGFFGFFRTKSKNKANSRINDDTYESQCDISILTKYKDNLDGMTHLKGKCCPDTTSFFGKKIPNKTPYCKQLEANIQSSLQSKKMKDEMKMKYEGCSAQDMEDMEINDYMFEVLEKQKQKNIKTECVFLRPIIYT